MFANLMQRKPGGGAGLALRAALQDDEVGDLSQGRREGAPMLRGMDEQRRADAGDEGADPAVNRVVITAKQPGNDADWRPEFEHLPKHQRLLGHEQRQGLEDLLELPTTDGPAGLAPIIGLSHPIVDSLHLTHVQSSVYLKMRSPGIIPGQGSQFMKI